MTHDHMAVYVVKRPSNTPEQGIAQEDAVTSLIMGSSVQIILRLPELNAFLAFDPGGVASSPQAGVTLPFLFDLLNIPR